MKYILELLAWFSLDRIFGCVSDLVKGYALRLYISAIDGARSALLTLVLALFCLLIVFSGFLMLHVALFMSLPWSLEIRLILLASLGGIYLFAPIIAINKLLSKERLLRISGAQKVIDELSKKP